MLLVMRKEWDSRVKTSVRESVVSVNEVVMGNVSDGRPCVNVSKVIVRGEWGYRL